MKQKGKRDVLEFIPATNSFISETSGFNTAILFKASPDITKEQT